MSEAPVRKLHPKIVDWAYFQDSEAVHILIFLIAKARLGPTTFMRHPIKRGEVVLGRNAISAGTGIAPGVVRTRIQWFKDSGEITMRKIEAEGRTYGVLKLTKFNELQKAEPPKRETTEYMKEQDRLKRNEPSEPFKKWWAAYKKGAMGGAWVAWQKTTNKPEVDKLIEITEQYKEYCASMDRPLMDGQGWINQRYFDSVWTHEEQGTEPEEEHDPFK